MVLAPYLLKMNFHKNDDLLYKNIKSKKEFSPLSGSELKYEPEKWNVSKYKNTHIVMVMIRKKSFKNKR